MKTTDIYILPAEDRPIPAEQLKELYASEPWWPERTAEDLQYVLDNHVSVGVWDCGKLIGFARAVTDGRFRAYIEDVLLLKEYRGKKVGGSLMTVLLDILRPVHVVTLFCQPKHAKFYTDLGFKEFSKQVVMHMRNFPQ